MNEKSSLFKKQQRFIYWISKSQAETPKKKYNVTHHILQFEKKNLLFFFIRIAKYHTLLYIPRVNVPVL